MKKRREVKLLASLGRSRPDDEGRTHRLLLRRQGLLDEGRVPLGLVHELAQRGAQRRVLEGLVVEEVHLWAAANNPTNDTSEQECPL